MDLPWAHREMGTMQMGSGRSERSYRRSHRRRGILLHTGGGPSETFENTGKKGVAGFSQQRKHSQLCDVDGDDVGDDDGDGGGGGDDDNT